MLLSDFNIERERFNREVENKAAELVRDGTPPYEAIRLAREIVIKRRRRRKI